MQMQYNTIAKTAQSWTKYCLGLRFICITLSLTLLHYLVLTSILIFIWRHKSTVTMTSHNDSCVYKYLMLIGCCRYRSVQSGMGAYQYLTVIGCCKCAQSGMHPYQYLTVIGCCRCRSVQSSMYAYQYLTLIGCCRCRSAESASTHEAAAAAGETKGGECSHQTKGNSILYNSGGRKSVHRPEMPLYLYYVVKIPFKK